jgi:hypothetical protein
LLRIIELKKSTVILLITIGLLAGSGVAYYRIHHWTGKDATIVNGSWQGNSLAEVGKNQLLTARIAVATLYALNPSEVIYMVAQVDSKGEELNAENDYVIKGVPLDARYWSVTLYGEDYFLAPNEIDKFGFCMNNISYESDSSFVINISSLMKAHNWLPSGKEGQFYLTLRLYHPQEHVYKNIESVQLPTIEKVKK